MTTCYEDWIIDLFQDIWHSEMPLLVSNYSDITGADLRRLDRKGDKVPHVAGLMASLYFQETLFLANEVADFYRIRMPQT